MPIRSWPVMGKVLITLYCLDLNLYWPNSRSCSDCCLWDRWMGSAANKGLIRSQTYTSAYTYYMDYAFITRVYTILHACTFTDLCTHLHMCYSPQITVKQAVWLEYTTEGQISEIVTGCIFKKVFVKFNKSSFLGYMRTEWMWMPSTITYDEKAWISKTTTNALSFRDLLFNLAWIYSCTLQWKK